MLFVHGSVSSGRMWRRIAGLTEGPHECPDLIGAVGTPTSALPEDVLEADLAVLEACLDRLDQPTTVVGHSYGGFLALQLALRHPEKVRAVVAHEPVCWQALPELGPAEVWVALQQQIAQAGLSDPEVMATDRWMQTFIEFWNGARGWTGLPAATQQALLVASPKTQAEVALVFTDRSLLDALDRLQCPVRLTVGRDGIPAERLVVELLAQALPDGLVAEVEGAHLAPLTHPRQLLEVWRPWLVGG